MSSFSLLVVINSHITSLPPPPLLIAARATMLLFIILNSLEFLSRYTVWDLVDLLLMRWANMPPVASSSTAHPPGQLSYNYRGSVCGWDIATQTICIGVSTICISMRMYSKLALTRSPGWEDCMYTSWSIVYDCLLIVVYSYVCSGLGMWHGLYIWDTNSQIYLGRASRVRSHYIQSRSTW